MSSEEIVGTHRVRVDGDVVLTRYIGVPEQAHVEAIHQRFDRVLAEHGRLFVINDMRRTGIPSTETRRWIAEWGRHHPVAGLINVGASLPIRMVQGLLFRAAGLLGRPSPIVAINCITEAEALAIIDDLRRKLALHPVAK
ncbi:MAG TPA: hypothetical protein VGB85_24960 [Nannocystis sp.]|jgi:hypothetical protein